MSKERLFYLLLKYLSKPHGILKSTALDVFIEKFFDVLVGIKLICSWQRFRTAYVQSFYDFGPSVKFREKPENFVESMAIVLKSPKGKDKGTILIAYNYAIPTFFLLFDINKVLDRYHLVLEPSTARYFMPEILIFKDIGYNVFIETPEKRDEQFLKRYVKNAVPVPIAANWWIDSRIFKADKDVEKKFDIIMASSWLSMKRHYLLFRALRELKSRGVRLNCVLVGYEIDLTLEDLRSQATSYGIISQITFREGVPPSEVANLYRKSKLNLLLSKREGCNRSIIEGFFCDVPCLIRDGFNFGQKYEYINDETGGYFKDSTLADDITRALARIDQFCPAKWVFENEMTASSAVSKLNQAIYGYDDKLMALKTSGLHGMEYWHAQDRTNFQKDYDFLLQDCLISHAR